MKKLNEIGIQKWNKYTGKGINVATVESVDKDKILNYKVINSEKPGSPHGSSTALTLLELVPDITLHSLPYTLSDDRVVDYVVKNNIQIIFASVNELGFSEPVIKQLKDNGVIIVHSGGNEDKLYVSDASKSQLFINIGSCGIDRRGNLYNIEMEHDYLDFCCFGSINIPHHKEPDFTIPVLGASYATPLFAGILVKIVQYISENYKVVINQNNIYSLIKDISWNDGLPKRQVGFGLPILPAPSDLDIKKHFKIKDDPIKENEEVEEVIKFIDVKDTRYSTKSIYRMVELGLLKGYSDNTFRPSEPISREDLAVVLDRLINILEG